MIYVKLNKKILFDAENNPKNRLMLISINCDQKTVYCVTNDAEKIKFKEAVTMDINGYKKWYSLALQPREVFSLNDIKEVASGLLN